MEFENDLKVIANDIYKRVVKYINDNKDNDDIMYEYAYLKLSNGLQVMYNFESGALYYTHPNEHGDYFFSYILKINNDNFELNLKNIEYDTLLCQKIKNSRSFNQRHAFEKDLLKQQNLSVREKEKIKRCFEKLNGLIESITYNKEKTRNENNYNSETFVVYNEYMYKKELNKQEEVLPGVKIAAEWWANAIIEEICYESIEDDYNDLNTNYEEQIKKFKEIFSKKLMDRIYESDEVIQIICDYGTNRLLYEAMKESGINKNFSFKADMFIRAYLVIVNEGLGACDITLYNSTEKTDLENVKKICCHENEQPKIIRKKL